MKESHSNHGKKKRAAKADQAVKNESRNKNPLFVVTNRGKDVEQVKGVFDYLSKFRMLQEWQNLFKALMIFIKESLSGILFMKTYQHLLNQFIQELKIIAQNLTTSFNLITRSKSKAKGPASV